MNLPSFNHECFIPDFQLTNCVGGWSRPLSCPAKSFWTKVRKVLHGGVNFATIHVSVALDNTLVHANTVQINKLIVSIYIKVVNFWCSSSGDDTIQVNSVLEIEGAHKRFRNVTKEASNLDFTSLPTPEDFTQRLSSPDQTYTNTTCMWLGILIIFTEIDTFFQKLPRPFRFCDAILAWPAEFTGDFRTFSLGLFRERNSFY